MFIAKKSLIISFGLLLPLCWLNLAIGSSAAKQKHEMPPAMVEVQKIDNTTMQDNITATGSLISIPGVVIRPEISGRITNVYFNSGDKVSANSPLIEIYPDIYKAQLADSEASLKLKQLDFARYAKLYQTHTVSKSEFDKAQADLASAEASVLRNRAGLAQTIVKAPFAGRVGISAVSLGQYITAGQDAVVSLQALDPIYVNFSVPEVYAGQIKVGQDIVLHSTAYPKESFAGKVSAIDTLVDAKTRSLTLRAAVPNKDERLLPGFFADVNLLVGVPKTVIKVPQTAIVFSSDGNYVYKVVDGKAIKTMVALGERDSQNMIVQSGLNIGDIVVTAGQLKIAQDGARVVAANP